jgi:vancomycin resistance protein VanJ
MASQPTSPSAESPLRRKGRKILYWVILLQLVAILGFIGVLVVGERSRWTLIALYLPRIPLIVSTVGCALLAPLTRRHVKVLVAVQILLSLVVLFPVMGFSVASSHQEKGRRIRLVSYNVHYGHEGRPRLVDELAAMPVDLIVLQASFGSMAEKARERWPDRTVKQDGEWVLVSTFPVRSAEPGPKFSDDTDSMYVKYVIDTPAGSLRLYNVHPYSPRHALFSDENTGSNIDRREDQIEAAATAARNDVPPFILVGDTNLPPMSAIGRRHLGGLRDAFEEAGFGFGYTFTAKRPFMRIDRCFGGDGIRFLDVRVGPRGASDHRPLFVDFEIER